MRGTGAIRVRAVPGGLAGRSAGCGAMSGGGVGGRVERPRGLGAVSGSRGVGVAARRVEVGLTAEAVEAVAQRVAELLAAHDGERQPELLTAGELARELRVERSWVYKHAHLLGGERIGDGPKAQWRFELDTARRRLTKHWAAQTTNGGL
jgi:hypothetical protein